MIKRKKELEKYRNGMDKGMRNKIGESEIYI